MGQGQQTVPVHAHCWKVEEFKKTGRHIHRLRKREDAPARFGAAGKPKDKRHMNPFVMQPGSREIDQPMLAK
jgi:hypothetical protein